MFILFHFLCACSITSYLISAVGKTNNAGKKQAKPKAAGLKLVDYEGEEDADEEPPAPAARVSFTDGDEPDEDGGDYASIYMKKKKQQEKQQAAQQTKSAPQQQKPAAAPARPFWALGIEAPLPSNNNSNNNRRRDSRGMSPFFLPFLPFLSPYPFHLPAK